MKADELVRDRCLHLVPSPADAADLATLRPALQAAAFTEGGLKGLFDPASFVFAEMPATLWRCHREGSARGSMVLLWMLNDGVERAGAEVLLGKDLVVALLEKGLLRERNGYVSAQVDLFPCGDAWVFTDHSVAAVRPEKHVYELGADSYTLARTTPRRRVGRVLDLCSGSGIHAILGAFHADESIGVDVNERAISYATVNAALNDVQKTCRFVHGDLYEAVRGQRFDLIVSNPPWIATPQTDMQLYRWGGETGEALTERIVAGLPEFLAPGGTLAMYVIYPVIRDVPYLDRLRSWLGRADGWGVAVADIIDLPLPVFVRQHLDARPDWGEYLREFGRWLDMFVGHGIEMMRCAMVYVRRLPDGAPGWATDMKIPSPSGIVSSSVETWLDSLAASNDPDWPRSVPEWKPALGSGVRRFWVDGCTGQGRIEHNDAAWLLPHDLDEGHTRLLASLDGTRTVADLLTANPGVEVVPMLRTLRACQAL